MHVLILGGDGYLGWPTAMYLSNLGYNVSVIDNYFRRNACLELDIDYLYPLPTLVQRASLWYQLTGKEIKVIIDDLQNPAQIRDFVSGKFQYTYESTQTKFSVPEVVIHYAEQPSAPYSLIDYKYANFTIINNLSVTNNLMFAIRDLSPDTHIIKLGTMGEYGTPNIDIEEGWLKVKHNGREDTFLFPRQASSLYHTTKIMDTDLLWFGVRMWDLKVTDLMQGPVYGIETSESVIDKRLRTIFNYDEIFGTVINRFLVQALIGYPLTIYGKGGQRRGYINIKDTLQCVHRAIENPATSGQLNIYNQIMETFSVAELADLISKVGSELGYDVVKEYITNPRKEAEDHYYNPCYQGLLNLGVKPHLLTEEALGSMFKIIEPYKERIRKDVIFKGIKW